MPELPEVEVISQSLKFRLSGLTIASFRIVYPPLLRNTDIIQLGKIRGAKVLNVRRRGKYVLIDTDGGISLLFHLKMTGRFVFSLPHQSWDKHTHFGLSFLENEHELRFRDVRKFGVVSCVEFHGRSDPPELAELGPEPLDIEQDEFVRLFNGRNARTKSLLLNQKFLAGIGNIYADEMLFRAGIHPMLSVSRLSCDDLRCLWTSMRQVLQEALECKGSSIRDFLDTDGREGDFQRFHRVYGREGLPCPTCRQLIKRVRITGRSSHYCPSCQKLPSATRE
ncbi:MAG: bifunctional DNA-formamidopyrimidine glycosylase/DNA-(apurinic or apyrimidinic site) lyase [Candidatus Aminicenantes bacterium]|nr:bifunctional DNA-formamidopyrimidine glycosylase/DNA-(apurinic or apyrimidinic site) lyase [Candidatus Aminicenantes bacterium]